MIFGFNTDVKHGDIVYHVQTEAHPSHRTFVSAVFVKGQCIGKKSTNYRDGSEAAPSDQELHEQLKAQHRLIVEAIREGRLEEVLKTPEATASDFL